MFAFTERILALSILGCTFVVAYITMTHGDISLGLLLVLGQMHAFIHAGSFGHQSTHFAVHNKI